MSTTPTKSRRSVERLVRRRQRITSFWRSGDGNVLVELVCGHIRVVPQRRKRVWSAGFPLSLECFKCQSPNATPSATEVRP